MLGTLGTITGGDLDTSVEDMVSKRVGGNVSFYKLGGLIGVQCGCVVKSQLNGANGEWTGSDDVAQVIKRALESSWLFNLVLFLRYLVLNAHRLIYLALSIAIKIRSLIFTWGVLSKLTILAFSLETNLLEYMESLWGFVQLLVLYNAINVIFGLDEDLAAVERAFNMPVAPEGEPVRVNQENPIFEALRRVVGAGKGKKMVNGKVKKKGTGGKSKVKKEIQAPQAEAEAELEEEDEAATYDNFTYSDFPRLRTRFLSSEINQGMRLIDFDCHGAPFCGLTCIDIAVGIKPKIEEYAKRAEACVQPTDLGTNDYLQEYANHRGVNLAFLTNNNGLQRIYRTVNSPSWDYVILNFTESQVAGEVGHWTLCCTENNQRITGNRESPIEFLGVVDNQDKVIRLNSFCFGLFSLVFIYRVIGQFTDLDKVDKREVTHRRDPSEIDDTYLTLESRYSVRIIGFDLEIDMNHTPAANAANACLEFFEGIDARVGFINNNLPPYLRFDFLFTGDDTILFVAIRYVIQILLPPLLRQLDSHFANRFREYLPKQGYHISFQKFKKAYLEAQTLPIENRDLALSLISQTKYVNTNSQIPLILLNTRNFAKAMIAGLDRTSPSYVINRVAVNAVNARSIVGGLPVILANQNAAMVAIGAGKTPKTNHVKKAKIKKVVVNRVIAQCPTIGFVNGGRQLGPGNICVTDDLGLLAAFCGRSMSKDPTLVKKPNLDKFERFSKKFIDRLVRSMDFSGIVEEDPRKAIRRLYTGKKPQNFIDSLVESYTKYLEGKDQKKYQQASCFNKLENSSKVADGLIRTKPRLIMVMSELMLMEYCQVLDVINAWNEGFVKRYQVKHETEQEVIRKVIEITSKDHMVTDYSSFECSVIGRVRQIENYCIKKCLKQAGLKTAFRRFTKDFDNARLLTSKDLVFSIDSRNSGDFHTSWMNGLINILVGAYTYSVNNPDDPEFVKFSMLAEGDDGLRKPFGLDEEIANMLGFGFSMSTSGSNPGDVDFLRARWIDGKRFLNVARCLKIAWTLSGKTLSRTKSKQIQRCAALSLNAISSGHPILWALVKRIMEETKPNVVSSKLKSHFAHMSYQHINFDRVSKMCASSSPDIQCDESMRKYVAIGAKDFPPISISKQLALEKLILDKTVKIINLIGILDDYEDIKVYCESEEWKPIADYNLELSKEMKELCEIVGAQIMPNVKIVNGIEDVRKYTVRFGT